jgi:hypothetical protein
MEDAALLYRGDSEVASTLADRLDARGIEYIIEHHYEAERHYPSDVVSYATIYVSAADETAAISERSAWLARSRVRARSLSQRLFVLATWSFVPAVLWLAASVIRPGSVPEPLFVRLAVVTGVSFVVLAQIEHRLRSAERAESPK